MVGLLDFLGIGGGQRPMQAQMPGQMAAGYQGQIQRGADGKNYQYAETTGMRGDNGGQGWIETSQQPQGGFLQKLLDPSVALPLAAALMQPGDIGSNIGKGLAGAGEGIATRNKLRQENAQKNATAKWLESQGADVGLVELAKSGGGAQALQMWQASKRDPMNELNIQKTQLEIDRLRNPKAEEDKYYGNPVYGTDANGNTVVGQMSQSGKFKPLDAPDGFKPSSGVQKMDLGDKWGLYDTRAGQMIGYEQKNLAEAERQKELGTAAGKSEAAAPGDVQAGQNALDLINNIRNDPNRLMATGKSSFLNGVPGTGAYDFQDKVEQAKSGAFLTAINQMRGLGALSNAEGSTATQAVTRMNTASTEEGFLAALADYEKIVQQGVYRARSRLGQQGQPQGVQAPQGAVQDFTDYFK